MEAFLDGRPDLRASLPVRQTDEQALANAQALRELRAGTSYRRGSSSASTARSRRTKPSDS